MRPAALAVVLTAAVAAADDRLPAFTATAVDLGRKDAPPIALDARKLERPTVWVTMGVRCPYTRLYVGRLHALERARPDVRFVYVYPQAAESDDAKRDWHRASGLGGPAVIADAARVARALGATQTSEAVLAKADGTVVYRGAIDDSAMDPGAVERRWLADALDALRAGRPAAPSPPVSGCDLLLR